MRPARLPGRLARRHRPHLEPLESRRLLALFAVSSIANDGPGSLRQAILDSNDQTDEVNTIQFAIPGAGVHTIAPTSPLPAIAHAVLVDGTSQPGYAGTPLIEIDGGGNWSLTDGLTITGPGATVRGLAIGGFFQGAGILITGPNATGARVSANHIGTDATGTTALPNAYGIKVLDGARGVTIGGTTPGAGNLISANAQGGVLISGAGTSGTVLAGNRIGTDPTGNVALTNGGPGVQIDDGATDTTVGRLSSADGSVRGFILASPTASPPPITVPGEFPATAPTQDGGPVAAHHLDLEVDGVLRAVVHAPGLGARLSLLDARGRVVVVSDGRSPTEPDPVLHQYLPAGKYTLEVRIGGWAGIYNLTTTLTRATDPFRPAPVGSYPIAIAAGDLDGDGHTDLAVADYFDDTASILLGVGDGTFRPRASYAVGAGPAAIAVGDLDGDGRTDLAVADYLDGTVSILLGVGDGTFRARVSYSTGSSPISIVARDLDGDGRTDLAVADHEDGTASILLGIGDGTFRPRASYDAGSSPAAIAAGDLDGDGRADLTVANSGDGTASVLLGVGDGTFRPRASFAVGSSPTAIATGDFDGDGRADIAFPVGDDDGGASVLLGVGDGTFGGQLTYPVGSYPSAIAAGDLDGDGRIDLAIANYTDGTASVLLGVGDGSVQPRASYAVGASPWAIAVGDLDGDGRTDLAVANFGDGTASVLLGVGDGTFRGQLTYPAGSGPIAIAAGDLDGDGRIDLVVANYGDGTASILLGDRDRILVPPGTSVTAPSANPVLADISGHGSADSLVLDAAGDILLRRAIPGQPGSFGPPTVVNPGFPSRDIVAVVAPGHAPYLASVDAREDAVSLYTLDGRYDRIGSLTTGGLPAQLIAADLDADGLTDLVVRNARDGSLSIFFGASPAFDSDDPLPTTPAFLPHFTIPLAPGLSDVRAVDTTGSGRLDLVTTNKLSAQVLVLRNLGGRAFAPLVPYRAGTGPSAIDTTASPAAASLEATAGLAAAALIPGGPVDLVMINPGSNRLGILAGLGGGRFANPFTILTQEPARYIRIADLDRDGIPDLALLGNSRVTVMLGDGRRGFLPPVAYEAGSDPTGLTDADIDGDGSLDLLIGNVHGDLLVLQGDGDGSFGPYKRAEQAVALAVADLDGDSRPEFVFASRGLDRVSVQYGDDPASTLADRSAGLLSPGAVQLADMDGDGVNDLVVANSGSNNILVYPGTGGGSFGPAANGGSGFFVGTNPSGFTVQDLNGDSIPDLVVANSGSNDVSVMLGQGTGAGWTLARGPRIRTDAGPVATALGDFNGDGTPDLAAANRQANTVQVFPGVGSGFFNEQAARTFPAGQAPAGLFFGQFGGGARLAAINTGSDSVTLIGPLGGVQDVPTGGLAPAAAFAGDFAGLGFTSLVVGNAGDGRFSLLLGGPTGLTFGQAFTSAAVPSPTSLSFAGLSDGFLSFYAASAGREAATLLAFDLNPPAPSITSQDGIILLASGPFASPSATPDPQAAATSTGQALAAATAGAFQQLAQLLGGGSGALDLIAPLFTVTVIPGGTTSTSAPEGGVELLASFLPAPGPNALVTQGGNDDEGASSSEGGEAAEQEGSDQEDVAGELTLWEQIITGLDRAWEEVRSSILTEAGGSPDDNRVQSPTRPATDAPSNPPPDAEPAEPSEAASRAAIDAALEELDGDDGEGTDALSIPGDPTERGANRQDRLDPPLVVAALASLASTSLVRRARRRGRVRTVRPGVLG